MRVERNSRCGGRAPGEGGCSKEAGAQGSLVGEPGKGSRMLRKACGGGERGLKKEHQQQSGGTGSGPQVALLVVQGAERARHVSKLVARIRGNDGGDAAGPRSRSGEGGWCRGLSGGRALGALGIDWSWGWGGESYGFWLGPLCWEEPFRDVGCSEGSRSGG